MSKIKFIGWPLTFRIVLDFVFYKYIIPIYSYTGLLIDLNIYKFLLSYLIFLFFIKITPTNEDRPSNQLLYFFLITTITPMLSIYGLSNKDTRYIFYITISYLILSSLLRVKKSVRIPLIKRTRHYQIKVVNIFFIFSVIILILFLFKYGGIDKRAFDFYELYDLRAEREYFGIWGYLVNWLGKVFIPICITIYLHKKKYLFFWLSVLLQVILFLSTGNKAVLFSVILIIASYYLLKNKKWLKGLPKFYLLIILIATILYKFFGYIMGLALFPLRMLIIPAQISFNYYDFFLTNPLLYFSEGFIGKILGIQSPYRIPVSYLLGNGANANTGYLADAFGNGGLFLMILYSIVVALLLLYVDRISEDSDNKFLYSTLFVNHMIMLNDIGLLTTLLTGGLLIMLFFAYFYASEEKNKNYKGVL